jgi:hypothetical protein
MEQAVADAVGADGATFIDASRLATRLMGHSIATNIFMLGYAFQRGLIPLSSAALLRAIELNGSTSTTIAAPSTGAGARPSTRPASRPWWPPANPGARPQAVAKPRRTGRVAAAIT